MVIDKWRHVIGVISTDVRVDKGKAVYAGLQRFVYSRTDGFVKDYWSCWYRLIIFVLPHNSSNRSLIARSV